MGRALGVVMNLEQDYSKVDKIKTLECSIRHLAYQLSKKYFMNEDRMYSIALTSEETDTVRSLGEAIENYNLLVSEWYRDVGLAQGLR